ncbi:grpE protein homolog 1, mitochondrial-like [Solanum lycopersicum]|uniref:grpE protein homolog 1, mitochondrial-like n=1 Tax=Solanum lycopersicum TaxID=4081 RepID=UPI003749A7A1
MKCSIFIFTFILLVLLISIHVTLFSEYVLQRLGFSFSPSQSQSKQGSRKENGEMSVKYEASVFADSQDTDDLSRDDLVKLLAEKEELLKIKDYEFQKMNKKYLRSYVEMENVINRTKLEEGNFKRFAIQVSFSRHVLCQILLYLLIGVVPLLKDTSGRC